MNMIDILCRAAGLSAQGASFLKSNEYDEAYEFFTKSLDIIVRAENNWLVHLTRRGALLEASEIKETLKMLPKHRPGLRQDQSRRYHFQNSASCLSQSLRSQSRRLRSTRQSSFSMLLWFFTRNPIV
jgi:hypothetical protein